MNMKKKKINSLSVVALPLLLLCFGGCNNYPNKMNDDEDKPFTEEKVDEIVDCDKCNGIGQLSRECYLCNGSGTIQGTSMVTQRAMCSTCDGKQRFTCNVCHGWGYQKCSNCRGRKNQCRRCDGIGLVYFSLGDVGEWINCPNCSGNGYEFCFLCDNDGNISCQNCGGKGWNNCPRCHGSGLGEYQTDMNSYSIECKECSGKGYYVVECDKCDGKGKIKESELD